MQGFGPWPRGTQDVLDYLSVRRAERAPRTAFSSLLGSLRFLEEAGEVASADKLSTAPAVTNAVKEHTLGTAEAASKGLLPTTGKGQAPQLPTALVVLFEEVVVDDSRPLYHRVFATFRLIRHWASLRYDDTQGLAPQSLEMRARGMVGVLERTKTSGPGKANLVLPCFVSKEAWVKKEWLATGL